MIICAIITGVIYFIFLACLTNEIKLVGFSPLAPLSYVSIVVVFILGIIFINEPIYFTNVIGSLLIVSLQFYNAYKPIKTN